MQMSPLSFDLTPEVRDLLRGNPCVTPRGLLEYALLGSDARARLPRAGRTCVSLSDEARQELYHIVLETGRSRNCLINEILRGLLLSLGPPPPQKSSFGSTKE